MYVVYIDYIEATLFLWLCLANKSNVHITRIKPTLTPFTGLPFLVSKLLIKVGYPTGALLPELLKGYNTVLEFPIDAQGWGKWNGMFYWSSITSYIVHALH